MVSVFQGFLLSFFLTMLAWNTQIEHRAFYCTDDIGFGFFWEDVNDHRGAGDVLAQGWTWKQLEVTRAIYITVFWLLCVAIGACAFAVFFRESNMGAVNQKLKLDVSEA